MLEHLKLADCPECGGRLSEQGQAAGSLAAIEEAELSFVCSACGFERPFTYVIRRRKHRRVSSFHVSRFLR